jgi:superfamily II DNA or RNA helicase
MELRTHQVEIFNAMLEKNKGQVLVPTGGGKTISMIADAKHQFKSDSSKTIVVVAPRILLASQLCAEFLEHIDFANAIHVHSGETKHFSTTNPEKIKLAVDMCKTVGAHQLIFTTYHSLHRIQESGIQVDTIYFDEAHNSVQRNFFAPTEYFSSLDGTRCFFFTATRRTSSTIAKPGMNDVDVYGEVIHRVSAPELIENEYIVPPKVKVQQYDIGGAKDINDDSNKLMESITESESSKILVCVKTTKQLTMLMQTEFPHTLKEMGYSYLYITAKTGAVVDGKKVGREEFFNVLNSWGKDPSKKFVVLHRSILSEGISVNGLETVIFLRNMDIIEMTQSIGRVLRTAPNKQFGLCVVPVYSKVGIATERRLQTVIDTVFEEGEMLDSNVTR